MELMPIFEYGVDFRFLCSLFQFSGNNQPQAQYTQFLVDSSLSPLLLSNSGVLGIMSSNAGLFDAAENGDVEEVRRFLWQGVNVNSLDGISPLHLACRNNHVDVIILLVDSKANIDANGHNDITPLHVACQREHREATKILLSNGANVNSKDFAGSTPLHFVVIHNDLEIVKLLIARNADVNATDNHKRTPLHGAKSSQVARVLLENGANVNATDNHKRTPLHGAKSSQVARVLLENGANVQAREGSVQNTPLHNASASDHNGILDAKMETAKCILEQRNGRKVQAVCHEMFFSTNAHQQNPLDIAESRFCQGMFLSTCFSTNQQGPLEVARSRFEFSTSRWSPLVMYLGSFVDICLAVSESPAILAPTKKPKRNYGRLGIKLNPLLNDFQQLLAEQALWYILQTPVAEVAYGILGYLSPADVMKRT
jgi:ankyrin repeat protein